MKAVGIDFGTIKSSVFAPVITCYNQADIAENAGFEVYCAANKEGGRSTESRILLSHNNVLIGRGAKGKNVISRFKDDLSDPKKQEAFKNFIPKLIQNISQLDVPADRLCGSRQFATLYSFHSRSVPPTLRYFSRFYIFV